MIQRVKLVDTNVNTSLKNYVNELLLQWNSVKAECYRCQNKRLHLPGTNRQSCLHQILEKCNETHIKYPQT